MERMDGEMVLHREEMVRLRGEIQTLEADAVELKTRLKDARRRQGAAARRIASRRAVAQATPRSSLLAVNLAKAGSRHLQGMLADIWCVAI